MTPLSLQSFARIAVGISCIASLAITGCGPREDERVRALEFEQFVPIYNQYISQWLSDQQLATAAAVAETSTDLYELEFADPLRETTELRLIALVEEQEKWDQRISLGDYLHVGTPEEIPSDLVWDNGMDQPEIGDPEALKGGAFRRYIPGFPPTIRPFGENSNNSFRGELYDYIDMPLVVFHPATMKMIPGLANEWASSADGRTTYFRIDPEARYSDGTPVLAKDFLISVYLRVSDNIVNPYAKQYFREEIAQVAMYDDRTVSISLPQAKLYAPAIAGGLTPSHPGFYEDYGPDYTDIYQWRFPPTTGAYEVLPEDIIKGVSVSQTRVKDWWAKDRKYYRYRFNPDKIIHTVVRDESKAFELFRAGELDTFLLSLPEMWYEKSEVQPVYRGYIERATFFRQYPKVPRGFYLNVTQKPLDNLHVRIGIQHAMHWQKVIDVMFRGDYQRLNAFNEGYVHFSDPSIRARGYSIRAAREAFRAAGFTQEGRDGILRKSDGTRLSVGITYPRVPLTDRMMTILREDSKACGLDLRLDGLEDTVAYKKVMQKQHQMAFASWLITPPVPDFYQFLHSVNAFDSKGNVKPQTNNLFSWGRLDTDKLSEEVRSAQTEQDLKKAAWQLQRIMHDEAIFSPAYSVDFVRVGSWRWLRWPDSEFTQFSPPVVYDPHETFVFWVDQEMQAETQAARRSNQSFKETTQLYDQFRQGVADPADEPKDSEDHE